MVNNKNKDTESTILEAAKIVFQKKGMTGARMQEIANIAGINKALLHYYFRNKQLLFEAVFMQAFKLMAPQLNKIINEELPLEEKIKQFSANYIAFVIKHPYLPNFIMQELNANPDFVHKLTIKDNFPNLDKFKIQLEHLVKEGKIRTISAEQLFINLMALCIFPFIGKPLLMGFTQLNEDQYNLLLETRRKEVAEFIINAIKINQ